MFSIGDKVMINEGIIGVTAIDRDKIYTIEDIREGRGFMSEKRFGLFLIFKECRSDGRFSQKYFHIVEKAKVAFPDLDEDLFIL